MWMPFLSKRHRNTKYRVIQTGISGAIRCRYYILPTCCNIKAEETDSGIRVCLDWSQYFIKWKLLIRMLAYSKPVLNFINGSKNEWRKLMSNESTKKNRFHKRDNYETIYHQLRLACKETVDENIDMFTNHFLLTEINNRLIELNAIPYTPQEIF